jgi:cytochrome d ubiquinol oxidase subunit I
MWLVAIGSNISAFWILVANSWMQEPVGYTLREGRAALVDFGALITNPHVWLQFPHVFFSGITTAAFFVLGISAYHLLKKSHDLDAFRRSFQWAAISALVGSILVGLIGHSQMQYIGRAQPMKVAAAEAVWENEQPASLSILTIGTLSGREEVFSIRIPALMSLLMCDNLTCGIQGMNELQAAYEEEYGPGWYVPPIPITYWSFRGMVGSGLLMIVLALYALYLVLRKQVEQQRWFLRLLPWAIVLPYLANTAGWLLAEIGRQPWIVYEVMRTEEGVSIAVGAGAVLLSLVVFTLLYGTLMGVDVFLLAKYARQGSLSQEEAAATAH